MTGRRRDKGKRVARNRLYDAKSVNRRPFWISEVNWSTLLLQWSLDSFKTVSERNKKNRASDCGGKGFPLHMGGSISHLTHFDKLKEKLGREPTVSEYFMQTHSRLNDKGERQWSDPRSQERHVSYVEEHEQPASDGASSQAPPLQVQLERWAEMEGGKKKGRVFGLAGFASQISGSSSSKGPTQRERELQNELSTVNTELTTVKGELSDVKEEVSTLKAKTANYDVLEAKVQAFEGQMAAWMRMMQPPQFPSTSGLVHGASLPFPSTVAPMPRGSFTTSTPLRPRPPHDPSEGEPVDSDED